MPHDAVSRPESLELPGRRRYGPRNDFDGYLPPEFSEFDPHIGHQCEDCKLEDTPMGGAAHQVPYDDAIHFSLPCREMGERDVFCSASVVATMAKTVLLLLIVTPVSTHNPTSGRGGHACFAPSLSTMPWQRTTHRGAAVTRGSLQPTVVSTPVIPPTSLLGQKCSIDGSAMHKSSFAPSASTELGFADTFARQRISTSSSITMLRKAVPSSVPPLTIAMATAAAPRRPPAAGLPSAAPSPGPEADGKKAALPNAKAAEVRGGVKPGATSRGTPAPATTRVAGANPRTQTLAARSASSRRDSKGDAKAVVDAYTAPQAEEGFGVWHDHAPSVYLRSLTLFRIDELAQQLAKARLGSSTRPPRAAVVAAKRRVTKQDIAGGSSGEVKGRVLPGGAAVTGGAAEAAAGTKEVVVAEREAAANAPPKEEPKSVVVVDAKEVAAGKHARGKARKECTCSQRGGCDGGLPETGPNGHYFSVGHHKVDVKHFMLRVEQMGGSQRLTQSRLWSALARELGIDPQSLRFASTSLKRMHMLLENSVMRASAGTMHWGDGEDEGRATNMVLEPFMDLLAGRARPQKKGGKKDRAARKADDGGVPASMGSPSTVVAKGGGKPEVEVDGQGNEEHVIQYLVEEVGVSGGRMAKVLMVFPQLRHLSVENNLRPTVAFLMEEAMVPREQLGKVVSHFPQVLGLSVESNLRPMLAYLTGDVGISEDKIGKVLVTRPQLLAACIEKNILPKINTLLEAGGVPESMIGRVVAKAPHLLGLSNAHINQMLSFLTDEVGVERSRVGRILLSSPQLLGLSIESNLRPKIQFLVEDIGVPQSKIGSVIGSFPNILGYNVENNMLPKLQYLADEVLNVPLRKMGRAVVTCPQLLGYSLENRIKPRHQLLLRRSMRLSISRMLAPSDLEFRRILRAADNARREQEQCEKDALMSFAERKQRIDEGESGLPPVASGELGIPLKPETMSGLFYWHYTNAGH